MRVQFCKTIIIDRTQRKPISKPPTHQLHMRTQRLKPLLQSSAATLGLVLLATPQANAVDAYQTVNQAAGQNWNVTASWGTPAAVSGPGTNYISTNSGWRVRTVDTASVTQQFNGDSLKMQNGSILALKHITAPATVNLLLDAALIQFHGASAIGVSPLAGTLQVVSDSTVGTTQGASQASDIWFQSAISGAGALTIQMTTGSSGVTNNVRLSGNNSGYSGNWNVTAGGLVVLDGNNTASPLGSGSVTLTGAGQSLQFNTTNNLTITNLLVGDGRVIKLNSNTISLNGDNPSFNGSVVVSQGALRLLASTAVATARITLNGGTLDTTALGGYALNDSYAQTMDCNGNVNGGLEAKTGTTMNFNFSTLTNDVLNITNGSFTLTGNPNLSISLVGFKQPGTYRLINYTGAILGGGAFNLIPPAGSSQMFALNTSTPGQVNLVITGNPRNLVWVGNGFDNYWSAEAFDINWKDGATPTSFAQGDNVTFDDSGSDTPDVDVFTTPTPGTLTVGSITISNTTKAYTFINDSLASFSPFVKRGTNIVELANLNNALDGPITIEGGILSIGNGSTNGSLGNPSAITNNGVFMMNKSAGGLTVSNAISGTGSVISMGGGTSLDLFGTNTYTGLTIAKDNTEIIVRNNDSLGSPITGTIVTNGGSIRFIGGGGYVVAEPLSLSGPGPEFPGALYANGAGNTVTLTGPITIEGTSVATRIRLPDGSANIIMTLSNTVTGVDTPLQCSTEAAGQRLVFADVLNLGTGGTAVLTKDGQATMVLSASGNVANQTIINGGTLQVDGSLSGPVTVNSTGFLGGSGTVLGAVAAASGGGVAPGSGGIGTLTLNSTLALDPAAVVRMEINRTNAQTGDLLVASAVPLNGTLEVVNVGPAPQFGDSFNLIDGAISGSFANYVLPTLSPLNLQWDLSQLTTTGVISVTTNSLPYLPLEATQLQLLPNQLGLTWNSYPSLSYTIEGSTNLATNNWFVVLENVPGNSVTNNTTQLLNLSAPASSPNVTLVQYQMGSADAQIQDAGGLMAAGPLTPGAGLGLFALSASLGYASDPVLQVNYNTTGTTNLAQAIANNSYFSFTLTVGANLTDLDLTSLTFNGARGGGATPRGYGVDVILPDTSVVQVKGETAFATQRPTWSPQSIDLSGVTGLQNLTAGQQVTFRIYHFSPTTGNSSEYDDITVKGNISPGLVPPYAGADKLFLRVIQQ